MTNNERKQWGEVCAHMPTRSLQAMINGYERDWSQIPNKEFINADDIEKCEMLKDELEMRELEESDNLLMQSY